MRNKDHGVAARFNQLDKGNTKQACNLFHIEAFVCSDTRDDIRFIF